MSAFFEMIFGEKEAENIKGSSLFRVGWISRHISVHDFTKAKAIGLFTVMLADFARSFPQIPFQSNLKLDI
jgi:hypothetical protein